MVDGPKKQKDCIFEMKKVDIALSAGVVENQSWVRWLVNSASS
jgi:hypothetical protein